MTGLELENVRRWKVPDASGSCAFGETEAVPTLDFIRASSPNELYMQWQVSQSLPDTWDSCHFEGDASHDFDYLLFLVLPFFFFSILLTVFALFQRFFPVIVHQIFAASWFNWVSFHSSGFYHLHCPIVLLFFLLSSFGYFSNHSLFFVNDFFFQIFCPP